MFDARGVTLWTIGHSSRTWDEFLALLRSQSIEVVADVRRHAGSRKHPQFGPEQLPAALRNAAIEYTALPELGGRRKPVPGSPNTAWRNSSFQGYADHMASEEYARGRELLLKCARQKRTAILCSEAVWWRCHRALIADDFKAAGALVLHIMSPTKVTEHPFTSAATVEDGEVRYDRRPDRDEDE